MSKLLKVIWIIAFVVVLFSIALPVFAQTSPVVGDVPTLDKVYEIFWGAFLALIASVSGGLLATTVTNIVKQVPALENIPVTLINAVVSGIIVVVALAANYFGVNDQFNKSAELAVAVLTILFGGTTLSSAKLWHDNVLLGVPVVGSQRTPD